MKLMKNSWLLGSALLLGGCNSVELGFVPLYVISPEVETDTATGLITGCSIGENPEAALNTSISVSVSSALTIAVQTRNNMQAANIDLQTMGVEETLVIANDIQPVRFDYRWECDSNGFTAGQGPIRLPAFGADRPFCLDRRNDATGNFAGFDIVSATGPAIAPGEEAAVELRIAPPQLISSMRDAFQIAVRADNCCRQAGSCQLASEAAPSDNSECQELQDIFDRVGGNLSASSQQDLQRWRPFVAHTSSADLGAVPYNMRLRGRFEGLTPDGDLITSTDLVQEFGFCEGDSCPFNTVLAACGDR